MTAATAVSLERIAHLGVVGAGGGGFPTATKLAASVPTVIVNGAECEPLLHKDKELLHHLAEPMLGGLAAAMALVGARDGIIGIKEKYTDVMDGLDPLLPSGVRILPLSDSYPAGDEFLLVYDALGRIIPPGGLPKDVGAVVVNVETLVNIGLDEPVTHKYLTVAGAVHTPVTLRVPIGTSIGEVIARAGGPTDTDVAVLMGGVMMGRLATGLDDVVTKTLGGLVVLPASHPLIGRYRATPRQIARIGRSACDQCRFCTDLCPRYLLGHPIEPHRAMRSLGFAPSPAAMVAGTLYCCECNLCSLYACPEDLDPKNVCVASKPVARELGLVWSGSAESIEPHPLAPDRRVPMKRLMARLGLTEFNNVGPLGDFGGAPSRVVLPLKQHAGAPAVPVVGDGDRVSAGDLVAAPPAGALGARIHASIAGVVRSTADAVVIEA
ncbi:MAG: SLBB domain-containing protein [Vicinamibacterales bacterium]|nr:SLBB domain-containing protein [Vicinamibacterales bacterium]